MRQMMTMVACLLMAAACGTMREAKPKMNDIAEEYVRLVLAMGQHDDGYVDAYYGPEQWRDEIRRDTPGLGQIRSSATDLIRELAALDPPGDQLLAKRQSYLQRQLEALVFRVRMLEGERFSFDQESSVLYGAVAPRLGAEHFEPILRELDRRLPGEGPLARRFERFRERFVIPPERLDDVFRKAIDGCRDRTSRWIELPEGEHFSLEYVTDKPWSGYNWYQGNFNSLIQMNVSLPIYIDRAIDLACHEGYPGHHVYNVMLEKNLVRDRGWPEISVYALYSPQSLVAEGTANYGIGMAFPGNERIVFEREELFPLAGLDPATADEYYAIQALTEQLNYAGNEAARRYLDGEISREEAVEWLVSYALMSEARAEQRTRFFDTYRSYVINYNLGKDIVRRYVEREGGDSEAQRWTIFERILSTPTLPQDLE
jgi:hypothetical protein